MAEDNWELLQRLVAGWTNPHTWSFSPHVGIFTLYGHFYSEWPFLIISHGHFSPHIAIVIVDMHLTCPCQQAESHLMCTITQLQHLTLCTPPLPNVEIIFFTSHERKFPKNHEASPIPSIRYPVWATDETSVSINITNYSMQILFWINSYNF